MDNITLEDCRRLRQVTGRGLYDCKQALLNSETFEDAVAYLRKRGDILVNRL